MDSSKFFSKDTCFDPNLTGPTAATSDRQYFYDAGGHRIAYKSLRYRLSGLSDATRDRTTTTIDDITADEQFTRLGQQAVLYVASFMRFYYQKASPLISAMTNGGFESGDLTGWTKDTSFGYVSASLDAHTNGRYSVRIGRWDQPYSGFGGLNGPSVPNVEPGGQDYVYQDISLPPDATSLQLTFNYRVDTYDGAAYDWFDAQILDANTNQELVVPVSHAGGIINGSPFNWGLFYTTNWQSVSVDLTPYKGSKVRIKYAVEQDGYGDQITTYVDNVALACKF